MKPGTFIRVRFGASFSRIAYVISDRGHAAKVRTFNASKVRWNAPKIIYEDDVLEHQVPVKEMPRGITYPPDVQQSGNRIRDVSKAHR